MRYAAAGGPRSRMRDTGQEAEASLRTPNKKEGAAEGEPAQRGKRTEGTV